MSWVLCNKAIPPRAKEDQPQNDNSAMLCDRVMRMEMKMCGMGM